MKRYLITHSLLSSWEWLFTENPYEDATTQDSRYQDFLNTLNKVDTPPTEAMQNGIEFENIVTGMATGQPYFSENNWQDAAEKVADIVRGGQFQFKAQKQAYINGIHFLMYGRLDVLKAGKIYDIKFTKNYDRGKYFSSTQHPMYLELVPEASEFVYVISNGTNVWTEHYTRDAIRSIFPVISDFTDWLYGNDLIDIYFEKWAAR